MTVQDNKTNIAVLCERIKNIGEEIEKFVTYKEFSPVRNIVFGMVGMILVAAMTAFISLIIK